MKKILSCLMVALLMAIPGFTCPNAYTTPKAFTDNEPIIILPPLRVEVAEQFIYFIDRYQ